MFEGFAGVWTPVARSRELGRSPLAVEVAGERVVLFRGGGAVSALIDRCPHRGVRLSLGRVTEAGALECPFHGWCFDGGGGCVRVPFNPESKRDRLFATSLPARDLGGLLWVRTSVGADAPDEPVVPPDFLDPRFHVWLMVTPWTCHWTRAMENMLDVPHLPYVHRRTIGRELRKQMMGASRMDIRVDETRTGFVTRWAMDGAPNDVSLEFTRPNGMTLSLQLGSRVTKLHVWCVPADAGRTRMIVSAARNFGRGNPLARLFDEFSRYIVHEDQAVVESSDPPEVPRPEEEKSVRTDRATLRFRRYYFDALRGSSTAIRSRFGDGPRPTPLTESRPSESSGAGTAGSGW